MNTSTDDTQERLKLSIHNAINNICKDKGINSTPEALLAMTELTLQKAMLYGSDLESFCKHAKRSTITLDDVKLLLRRNERLFDKLCASSD